jgi:hypothetical protein
MPTDLVYTLTDLVSRLGAAKEDEARALLDGLSDAELVKKGADIGTPRLVRELARNYGAYTDWLPSATPEQLGLLGFVDADWLRIAAWCGQQAESLHGRLGGGTAGAAGSKVVLAATASDLEAKGRAAVGQLRSGLRFLSGGQAAWAAKIDVAASTALGVSHTADALDALCGVGEEMLKDASPGITARRARSKLTAQLLADLRAQAAALSRAVVAADAVKNAAPVTQSEVDLWDGFAITFFEQFVEATEAARETDPTIPAPSIIGLRSWFRRGRRKKKKDGADDGTGGGDEQAEPQGTGSN